MFDGQKNELVELPNLRWVHPIYILPFKSFKSPASAG